MITYKIEMAKIADILESRGVMPGGKIQKMATNEIINISDSYAPFDNGPLKNNLVIGPYATYYEHISPYARYHWYGLLMVDPEYKKGALFSPTYGFWSRPGVQKELTNKKMDYQGAPMRGPKWTLRAWADHGEQICKNLEKEINK